MAGAVGAGARSCRRSDLNRLGGERTNGGPQGYEEKRRSLVSGCLCELGRERARLRALLREYSSSPGIKCGWMSHRFIPNPVISYRRGGGEGATKGEEWSEGFVNAAP